MRIDTSIYERKSAPVDIMGAIDRGQRMGDMIKNRKLKKEQEEKNKAIQDAFKNNLVQSEDGKMVLDRQATIGEVAKYDPEKAMKLQNTWNQEESLKQKAAMEAEDRKFDRQYKNQMMKNKDREFSLKEKATLSKIEENKLKSKKIKADQYKVGGFAKRAQTANELLSKMPEDVGTGGIADTLQGSSFFPEALKSDQRKEFEQAQRNFISSVLRRESGAAISDQEMENEAMKYFPQPGDGKDVLAQKAQARAQAINNLTAEAGDALESIKSAPSQSIKKDKGVSSTPGISNAYAGTAIQEHPQSNQAVKWAQANKSDPRAKEILKRFGY